MRAAIAALLLSAACLAAPLPFPRKETPVPGLLSRLARGGEQDVLELSARIRADSVRGGTAYGLSIQVYDAPGTVARTISARECDFAFDARSNVLVMRTRVGCSLSTEGCGALWDEKTLELPWRPAAK